MVLLNDDGGTSASDSAGFRNAPCFLEERRSQSTRDYPLQDLSILNVSYVLCFFGELNYMYHKVNEHAKGL